MQGHSSHRGFGMNAERGRSLPNNCTEVKRSNGAMERSNVKFLRMRCPWIPSLLLVLSNTVSAQALPGPSRTVYKCESGGKVTYSDSPCIAAKRIDIEPTRGLTSTGKEPAGTDVQREAYRERLADALRPVSGMDAKRFDQAVRRHGLSSEAKQECQRLDVAIAGSEAAEREASKDELRAVQSQLLKQRQRFRDLRCDG